MGKLAGYVQRSLRVRQTLWTALVEKAARKNRPIYREIENAFETLRKQNNTFSIGVFDRARFVRENPPKTDDFLYRPVYVRESLYTDLKVCATGARVPLYLVLEEMLASVTLTDRSYASYMHTHYKQGR